MLYNPYSPSKINSWESCPRKFKYQYIDKVPVPREDVIHFTRGKIVHSLLEHHDKTTQEKFNIIKQDKDITRSAFYTKDVVKECFGVYNNFVKTDLGKELMALRPLGKELSIGLNKKLEPCGYYDKDTLFRGLIDAILGNEETDELKIIDWKTGTDKSEGMYKQSPDQLLMYAAWYFNKMPVDKLTIDYVFVEHENKHMPITLTRDSIDKYNKLLITKILRVEKDKVFDKNVTNLCEWCKFKDHCDADTTVVIDEDEIPF